MRNPASTSVLLLAFVLAAACASPSSPQDPAGDLDDRNALLVDVTQALGLPVSTGDWPDGSYALPEITHGGVALLDYDGDGDLDLMHARIPPPGRAGEPAPNRLYRQQADGTFSDVSDSCGCADPGFGQGFAVGDVDNDGDPDVYVTNYGPDTLLLNGGDGTFIDGTAGSGITGDRWSSSATFCDYDADGHLDLYVAQYLMFDPDNACLDTSNARDYCGPQMFRGEPDRLYRNNGDGTFRDVTVEAGIVLPEGGKRARGLGVVCADLTGDDRPDFYVANDGESNQLWVNRGDGTFADEAVLRGVAVNAEGETEAGMGIAVGDVDGDEQLDLLVTHLELEHNTLYMGGAPLYFDRSKDAKMGEHDRAKTGFGCGFFDLDHDGDLDLAVANGRVKRGEPLAPGGVPPFWRAYAEPNLLFLNDGNGTFSNAAERAGSFARRTEVSRGMAFGDIDGDGDVDIVISNIDNSLRVYRNDGSNGHWLRVRALTRGRDAAPARVVARSGERVWLRLAQGGYSFASASEPLAHFGLGSVAGLDSLEVIWPDGTRELFPCPGVDRTLTLVQGEGSAP